MESRRLIIGRLTLTALIAFFFISTTSDAHDLPKGQAKKFHLTQLSENINSLDFVTLPTSTEGLNEVSVVPFDSRFFSFESFYSNILKVQLAHVDTEKESFRSELKIYLHHLSIVI